uniref:Uncharacterized protein n=1 Tax=Tetraselmis sp. GSL018 TaxID=582737 RepID=A0A061RHP4_9CHLO
MAWHTVYRRMEWQGAGSGRGAYWLQAVSVVSFNLVSLRSRKEVGTLSCTWGAKEEYSRSADDREAEEEGDRAPARWAGRSLQLTLKHMPNPNQVFLKSNSGTQHTLFS